MDADQNKTNGESEFNEQDLQKLPKDSQISILKKQNEKLRNELKVINEFLTQALQKQKQKQQKPQNISTDLKEDTLRQELINANKQIDFYKKEHAKLLSRIEKEYKQEMVDKLRQDLLNKDQQLIKLQSENKTLQKQQREQNKAFKDYDEEVQKKQNQMLTEENKSLREQLKNIKKKEPTLPVLIRPAVQEIKDMEAQPNDSKKMQTQRKEKEKDDNNQQIQELEKNLQILQKLRKQYDIQLEELHHKIKILEDENKMLKQRLEESQKQFNSLNYRPQAHTIQISSRRRNESHQPTTLDSEDTTTINGKRIYSVDQKGNRSNQNQGYRSPRRVPKFQVKKQLARHHQHSQSQIEMLDIDRTQPLPPPIVKHIEKGTINLNNQKFDDREVLRGDYNFKVQMIRIWLDENNFIKGLQFIYLGVKGKIVQGKKHFASQDDRTYIVHSSEFDQFDYLKQVGGKLGLKGHIEFIEVQSFQGKIFKTGLQSEGQRSFKFEMMENEVPVCFFGSLDINSNSSALASLGCEFIRDEIDEEV